jgi:glycosyltransferase involved in cell wall biosynthesis
MKILITSILDIEITSNNRLVQVIEHLMKKNDITLIQIKDSWKRHYEIQKDSGTLQNIKENIEIKYIFEREISPFLQEALSFMRVNKLLKEIKYETFDIHFNYNSLALGYAVSKKLQRRGINTVLDIADDLPEMIQSTPQIPFFLKSFGKLAGEMLLRQNIRIAKKITITSESLGDALNIPDTKMEVIPNGVDLKMFGSIQAEKERFKKELGLNSDFVIGFVGMLREWVDFEPLFKSVKDIGDDYDVQILIVGDGEKFKFSQELADKYGLSNQVIFTGGVPYKKVPLYMSIMDVGVIPFKKNKIGEHSCPHKLFEYLACGVPVISNKLTEIKKIANDRILYASTEEEYRENFIKLYTDKNLREKMSIEGGDFVKKEYSLSKVTEKIENILKESIDN